MREADITLRDGSTVRVRRAAASDLEPLAAFLDGLSPQARWLRFLGTVDVHRMSGYLLGHGVGLIATTAPGGVIVAHACYVPDAPGRAEVALAVGGDWQDHEIATPLLARLAELAVAGGITTLSATVHPTNHRMMEVFRESGFPVAVSSEPGELHVLMPARLGRDGGSASRSASGSRPLPRSVAGALPPRSAATRRANARRTSRGPGIARRPRSGGRTH